MKNCIVLGFGRSGTSLMGGILFHSGYFLGDDLFPPRESNPLGFFETDVINGINETILSKYDYINSYGLPEGFAGKISSYNPVYGQRWLTYIEPGVEILNDDESVVSEIRRAVSVPSFAYKDPRFTYTLPIWKDYLPGDTVYICMFRQPDATADSVLKDCKTADYLEKFYIERDLVFRLWYHCYERALGYLTTEPRINLRFVHYEQLLSGEIVPELSELLETHLDTTFITPDLNRSRPNNIMPDYVFETYRKLCHASGHRH